LLEVKIASWEGLGGLRLRFGGPQDERERPAVAGQLPFVAAGCLLHALWSMTEEE
jgi:hypothetical protein